MSKIVVGIHIGHDRSTAVVKDGVLLGHLAEERLDRIKHSPSVKFPKKSLFRLLDYLDIELSEVSQFVISYAFVNIDKVINGLAEDFKNEMGLPNATVLGVSHHLAHAYSTFYTSNFTDALIFVADGAGDVLDGNKLEAESAFIGTEKGIELLWQRSQDIPSSYSDRRTFYHPDYIIESDKTKQISLARKYEQLTYGIGFGWGQSGKTMGLSSFGSSLVNLPIRVSNPTDSIDLQVQDLVFELDDMARNEQQSYKSFVMAYKSDVAATVQLAIESSVFNLLEKLSRKTDSRNLCLAGGLFLNCVLNHKILKSKLFESIHICPASGDDGQSIGAAFYGFYIERKGAKIEQSFTPYLGISYPNLYIERTLKEFNYEYVKCTTTLVASLLEEGFVGGIFRGRSESGPRALGHRSIIASPRKLSTREHINRYVKNREVFRPFAPMVLEEEQYEYFDLLQSSPYMLLSTSVKSKYKDKLQAITHVDGTARIQSVNKDSEPFIFELLHDVKKLSGFPIILNTSFNGADEPLVETPRDALNTFERCNLDFLIIEDFLILPNRSNE
ncbi:MULTISPECIES: carbamoyltransferase C-terminal domain-containing protein [Pseudoalteromonas]|uniref:Carbamoyl transferase n=1 Tax=Pseudoalteromonas amylolytica TaxID=1859457 RepID=A0A1S1MZT8_9GAMM|nr:MULTISPECIES: carbamoyltransferase C-terminal domain-containing protein [Pseudoalteromonas]OHU92286.1 hypothetical protein BFC16_00015 [Pseudoalteromonas sp. JW3]OHU93266.1 hypothetical protein BET10_00015 [Pseudoalteromonas amylolytica]